jgi:two-component system cell cycle sensor histidine kinase/response regulator CckA
MSSPSSGRHDSSRPATGRSFFEAPIPLALLTFDAAALILVANEPFARLVQRDRGAVVGRRLDELVAPSDVEALRDRLMSLVAGETDALEAVARVARADGTTRWVRLFAKRFIGDDDRPCTILDVIDINDEVDARDELRASEERYRLIVQLAREGIWTIGAGGVTTFANDAMASMLGREPSDLIGREFIEFIHPDERAAARESFQRRFRGISEQFVRMLLHRDGRRVLALINTSPLTDDEGRHVGAVAVVSDVTEAHAAQLALEASERRLSALIAHSWDIIAVLEPDGPIRSVSSAATRLLGWQPDAGPDIDDLVLPEDMPIMEAAFREVVEGTRGPDTPVRFRVVTTSGDVRVLECVAQNLIDDPDVRGIVFNSRDITDRVRVDDALREQERRVAELSAAAGQQQLELELQRARRLESVGRLAGGVAHDFNNLLGVITNYCKALGANVAADTDEARDVEAIRRAAERGSLLVRRLLRLGGHDAGTPETLDLNAVCDELLTLTARALGAVRVQFACDREPCWVRARRDEMEQVVLNLLLNARDASPSGGVIQVSVGRGRLERLADLSSSSSIVLAVRDHGVGMSPEVQALATEPFFTTKSHESGSGLGLTTVLASVERAGGTLRIESTLGAGTTVTIALPVVAAPAMAKVDAVPETARPRQTLDDRSTAERCCVLVVDDDPDMLASTVRALRVEGYEVESAGSADDALALLEAGAEPSVMVTDIRMPDMTGVDLARRVWRGYRLPSVLVTGGGGSADPAMAEAVACAAPIVVKPFLGDALVAAIENTLRLLP